MAAFADFAARAQLPVAAGFRRQDAFPNTHACYAGVLGTVPHAALFRQVREADVILAVGTRLGEMLTQGYTLITPPKPAQKLIHVYPDSSELNKVYKSTLAIHSGVADFAQAVKDVQVDGIAWAERTRQMRADFIQWTQTGKRDTFKMDAHGVMQDMLSVLPDDAIITTGAGNYTGWAQRFISYDRPRRLLAPTSGAMGYAVPAAVAASLVFPDRAVIAFTGDGDFMMTGQELATAMHEGAHPIFLVFNNGMYGTIRMHQEKHYPGRVSATSLTNPDFAALAKSHGAEGYTVANTNEFLPVFKKALADKKPAIIELQMDPEQITTEKKLSEIGK